jgi:glycine betaine transporter
LNNNNISNSPPGDQGEIVSEKSAFASPLLITALVITGAIAIWGLIDTAGLAAKAAQLVHIQFVSRAWFIMLAVSFMLITSIWLAFSRYGGIRLGQPRRKPK